MMPALFGALGVFLAKISGPLVARILGALGMGVLTVTGVQAGISNLLSSVHSAFGGITADIVSLVSLCGFDVFLSLVISAYVGIITMRTLLGGFRHLGFIGNADGGN